MDFAPGLVCGPNASFTWSTARRIRRSFVLLLFGLNHHRRP